MITHIRDAVAAWLNGSAGPDWKVCPDCEGSGFIILANHIEDGPAEVPGKYADGVNEENGYYYRREVYCGTCRGMGAFHYEDGLLIPGKGDEYDRVVLGRVNYRTYIQSQIWRDKATIAKARAGWRCLICNRPSTVVTLDAHHNTYERLGYERPDDITVLCRDCHELYESNRRAKSNGTAKP